MLTAPLRRSPHKEGFSTVPRLSFRQTYAIAGCMLIGLLAVDIVTAQQPPQRFGGAYSELDERRQQTRRRLGCAVHQGDRSEPRCALVLRRPSSASSAKTTFDAVTHALLTTPLTDASGQKFGDGLSLIERVDSVKGEVSGASGDRQFRMYVRLTANAREMLNRSREFKRGVDNTVYHKGYPINYREQRGTPSIQVSIALDGRLADVDVDYRSSVFPVSLFNGHLSAANSDVRAGDNAERHAGRWSGFQNWWRSFFGSNLERTPAEETTIPRLRCRKYRARARRISTKWCRTSCRRGWSKATWWRRWAMCRNAPTRAWRRMRPTRRLRSRARAVSDHGQSESRSRRARQARLARGAGHRRPASAPWASRGVPVASSPVCSLRSPRRPGGQVRLREPADPGRADEAATRLRAALWLDVPHRRSEERHVDRVAVGQGGRLLEDRVLAVAPRPGDR